MPRVPAGQVWGRLTLDPRTVRPSAGPLRAATRAAYTPSVLFLPRDPQAYGQPCSMSEAAPSAAHGSPGGGGEAE